MIQLHNLQNWFDLSSTFIPCLQRNFCLYRALSLSVFFVLPLFFSFSLCLFVLVFLPIQGHYLLNLVSPYRSLSRHPLFPSIHLSHSISLGTQFSSPKNHNRPQHQRSHQNNDEKSRMPHKSFFFLLISALRASLFVSLYSDSHQNRCFYNAINNNHF